MGTYGIFNCCVILMIVNPPVQPVQDYLDQMAISEDDSKLLQKFHNELSAVTMDECGMCCEKWFDMDVDASGICRRCRNLKPAKKGTLSDTNHMNPGLSIQALARVHEMKVPEVLSQVEEMMISPVHPPLLELISSRYMS